MDYIIEISEQKIIREKVTLLPCPFCGGNSELRTQKHCGSGAEFEYTPRCLNTSCAGRLSKKWLNKSEAIIAWNKRLKQ